MLDSPICEYLESLWYRWKYRNYKGSLKRSEEYTKQVKELLLKELTAMQHAKVINI